VRVPVPAGAVLPGVMAGEVAVEIASPVNGKASVDYYQQVWDCWPPHDVPTLCWSGGWCFAMLHAGFQVGFVNAQPVKSPNDCFAAHFWRVWCNNVAQENGAGDLADALENHMTLSHNGSADCTGQMAYKCALW